MKVNTHNAVKRVLPVFLTLAIAVTAVFGCAVHASAVDMTDKAGWINLLDYTTVESASNYFVVSGTKEVAVSLPYQTNLFYVDMVLYVNGSGLSSAKAIWPNSGSSTSLSIYSLGNSLYRVYGAVPTGNYSSFKFSLTSSGTSYVTCQNLRVCSVNSNLNGELGSIVYDGHEVVSMTKPSTMVTYLAYSEAGSYGGTDEVIFNVPSWHKYDAVDIVFQVECEGLVYVSSYVGAYNLPVSLTYLGSAEGHDGTFYAVATINLEGVPRDLPYDLSMKVGCDLQSNQFPMALREVNGITYIEPPSALRYWFTNLFDNLGNRFTNVINSVNTGFRDVRLWLSSGFQSVVNKLDVFINGSQAQQDKADQIQGAVDDYNDQMQGVNRPDVNDDQFDVDTVIGADNLALSIGLFASIAQNEVASSMIVIVVIFMLGSYVLFGKKA